MSSESSEPVRATFRSLSPAQWRSGIAAWLGWMFDGLDMHLYTLVATPFVAELLGVTKDHPSVGPHAAWIQGAFLLGWALGGGFFGRIGDRIGRSRALVLTILTYAMFTGLSYFATAWWHLLIFRFLAALGIGGEWAVGAALLSESWPKSWRPMIAAVLQSGGNLGVLLASVAGIALAGRPYREVFLVGVIPAFLVLWIRKAVPEPHEWQAARDETGQAAPSVAELFRGEVCRTTLLTIAVCGLSLTAHWAFMFWNAQHLRILPEAESWSAELKTQVVGGAFVILMVSSIVGNFIAGGLANRIGFRKAIVLMLIAYAAAMLAAYRVPRDVQSLLWVWFPLMGAASGVFGLFTMYLPPLFPVLLRTTGAGFCYNIGRIASAVGTVALGIFWKTSDIRLALFCAGFLFLPAALVAAFLPELPREPEPVEPLE